MVFDGVNMVFFGFDDVREEVLREGVIIWFVVIGSEVDKKIDKFV